jgi:murein DD-endopeptidase MepM/ murein hydrolase activator NlpD
MPRWQIMRDTLLGHALTRATWRQLKRLGTASESPKTFALVAAAGVLGLVWLNIQPRTNHVQPTEAIATSEDEIADTKAKAKVPVYEPPIENFTLKRGETLITLLRRATINRANAHSVVNKLKKITNLRRMQAGQIIRLKRQAVDGRKLAEIRVRDTFDEEAVVQFTNGRYRAQRKPMQTYHLTHLVQGEITDSLYLSALRAGLPKKIIIDLIRMMSFDIDFEREIRTGDQFLVYFERSYSPIFGDIENGRILRARLTLKKRTLDSYYYREKSGDEGYFDASGQSTRRALMKTPLDVAVLTSSYGKRKHPVLGYTRMHKGSDFRAPRGTPIMAAGDGIIEMSARNGSYGNYVRIRHGGSYKTAYAHLSRYGKGIKKGRRVKQGQIIGYAGATGRVTAAHLHYEVLVDGNQVNPMRLKLPTGRTLKGKELATYLNRKAAMLADIKTINEQNDLKLAAQTANRNNASPKGATAD